MKKFLIQSQLDKEHSVKIKGLGEVVATRDVEGTVIVDSKSNLRTILELIKVDGHYKDWFVLVRANKDIHEVSAHLLSSVASVSLKFLFSSNHWTSKSNASPLASSTRY